MTNKENPDITETQLSEDRASRAIKLTDALQAWLEAQNEPDELLLCSALATVLAQLIVSSGLPLSLAIRSIAGAVQYYVSEDKHRPPGERGKDGGSSKD